MADPRFSKESLFPEAPATLNLGSPELRWLEAFLTNLNVSTRATVPAPINGSDAATRTYVDGLFNPVIGTIEEVDGAPSLTQVSTIRVDQADGFVLTQPSAGIARLDLDDVPYATLQNVSATDRLLGRSTAGAGVIEEITCTAAGRALLDDATAAAQRTTLGSTVVGDAVFIAASAAAARTAIGTVIGTDVQAWDADLDAVAALAATAGMLSRTGAGAFVVRTIAGTASNIAVANGNGAAADPTIDLVDAGPGATGPIGSSTVIPIITIDAKGRVTALTSAAIGGAPTVSYILTGQMFLASTGTPTFTSQGDYVAWDFDAAAEEGILAEMVVPQDWSGAVTLVLHWTNRGAGAGNVVWNLYVREVAAGGSLTTGSALYNASTTIAAPAQNVLTQSTLGTMTPGAAGRVLSVRLARMGADAADTLGNDAGALLLEFRYTATG